MSNLKLMFQCPSCGSAEGVDHDTYIRCRHCGNRYAKELMDSSVYADLSYAMNERQEADFDKARRRYDALIARYQGGSGLEEAHWGRFLCEQYVIFYQNDLDESIPSFWNINEEPCAHSESYQKALALGEESGNRENYERLARQIEEYKEKYRRVKRERPEGSQIFICFKDTGTADGRLGYRIFNTFARKYNVFFSKESLLDIAGNDYEPYIYHALTTAKVLLVLCSHRDHLESKWVHNEWWRFWRFAKGSEKVIIPIFREGFDASQLPDELRACQGIPADIGLLSTLSARFEAIFKEEAAPVSPPVAETPAEDKVAAYLEKAYALLSHRDFATAADYCEQILRLDPMNGEAYLCRLMADRNVESIERLLKEERPYDRHRDYEKAIRYLPAETAKRLKEHNEALRRAQEEKAARAIKWVGIAIVICLGIAISIAGIYTAVRNIRYEKGMELLKTKNVKEAYEHLDFVGDYEDALKACEVARNYLNGQYSDYIRYYGLTEFTVPDGTTVINGKTVNGGTQLTKVTLPDSVTFIGDAAFKGLTGMTEITLPKNLKEIGASAFEGCTGLTGITIPSGVSAIGESAFAGCTGLTSVTLPEGVTTIGNNAFRGCTGLTSVTLPEGLQTIGNYAFYNCVGLTELTIPTGVIRIGEGAFQNCAGLTKLVIPEGVTTLHSNMLSGCENLKTLVLPKTLETAYRIVSDLNRVDVFYCGPSDVSVISIFGENSFGNSELYFYSETEKADCWRYVDGVPTLW